MKEIEDFNDDLQENNSVCIPSNSKKGNSLSFLFLN